MQKFKELVVKFFTNGIFIIPLLLILDIVTKIIFEAVLLNTPKHEIDVIPGFFKFDLVYNDGAAWGLLSGQPVVLCLISIVAGIGLIVYLIKKFNTFDKLTKIAFYLLIPGCLGNLYDRFFFWDRGVVDFLGFRLFGFYDFPRFNLADTWLTVGMVLLIISWIIAEVKAVKNKKAVPAIEDISEENTND